MAQQETDGFAGEHHGLQGRQLLGGKLFGDLFAAAFTAALVAPSVTLIDRAVVEKASSNKPLLDGLRAHAQCALARPKALLYARPFGSVWTLYAGTYAVSNSADTSTAHFGLAAAGTVCFASTLAVNIPLGVRKDLRFAQCYGSAAGRRAIVASKARPRIPRAATAAFLARDALTVFGSFVLPPRVAACIPDDYVPGGGGPHGKATLTQMTVPAVSQLAATPVHLLGLGLYGRSGPSKVALRARLAAIWRVLPAATAVRCVRVIPAFGLGLLANREARWFLHGALEGG